MNKLTNFMAYFISLYIFLLPILPSKFKYNNIPINGDIILGIIIIIYLINIIIIRESRKRFIRGIKDFFSSWNSIFMFLWVAMMFISIIYATDKKLALQEGIRISTYVVLFFIIKYDMYKKEMIDKIIYSSISVSLIIGIIGIYEYFNGLGLQQSGKFGSIIRVSSTIENSNNLGAFFLLILFPFIILTLKEKNRKRKILLLLCSLLTLFNIIVSFSRNAWLGLIIGYIALIFVYNLRLVYGGILGSGIAFCIPKISNRLREIGDISQNLSRVSLWTIAVKMIKEHPILGVGNGNYRTLYSKYYNKVKHLGDYKAHENFHPHNAYLKAQCELGIVGSISLIGFLVSSLIKTNKFSNNVDNDFYKYFYKGFTASIVAFMFMNFIDNFFSAPKVVAFFFIFLAISDSYSYNIQNKSL
ncbi:exopolysaccharide biosynthesis protein [Clostridium sporogenes]|uniref:O-antigen ligase family protein n=1 Tax=Clostridium TaxID=1485 RepID=UPI00077FF48B|nr:MULTISPECIES: O-antigen ligase family protein [Clostridium]KYN77085.1 exopolysaccharide biosynthesis protein [Clostridium sporogenes]MBE6056059.1 O-antigen ligase family protein [Clostridium sp.]NFM18828.1 O-antigen ligase family protein [Clostridium sporogenes]